ncbi:LysR substrate-binding domain-containing protein [Pseudonocardia xinjiangensis]|uniref:LysR substrate-binding domain-containing protein n=1 Tax=Pseudonocardia xinjiangensis TaxID=75289 RepID=UPI003D92B253
MALDVRRLLLLAEVGRRGSITAAAATLTYTPSAVSQQISRLEAEAGQPLLERHVRGVTLTGAGRALVAHAERIERELRAARTELDDLAGLRSGYLRVGTFPTVAASFLPLVVREFRRRHPAVNLVVHSARREGLLELLEEREAELSLLWDYAWSRTPEDDLDITHLLDDPTALVVSTAHPLAARGSTTFAELALEQWIVRSDHPVSEVLTRSCRAAGFEPKIAYMAHDYQEAQAMAAVGIGIALAPRLALTGLRDDVTTVGLGPDAPVRRILLARSREHRLTPAAQSLHRMFQQTAHALQSFDGSLDQAVRQ